MIKFKRSITYLAFDENGVPYIVSSNNIPPWAPSGKNHEKFNLIVLLIAFFFSLHCHKTHHHGEAFGGFLVNLQNNSLPVQHYFLCIF